MKTITSFRVPGLPVALTLCCVFALWLATTVNSEAPKKISPGMNKEAVRMFDIGLGPHTFNFQLGRDTQSRYLGSPALQQALQSSQVQPRSMISNDFNGDSMGDLVIGYANNGAGVLAVRQGNLQAIAPTDPTVFQAITQGRFPSPFLPEVKLYQLPEAPDFLQFGDFDSDGHSDVMASARGGQRMYLLAGDGDGNLGAPQAIEVPGLLTEMQAATEQLGTFTQLAVGLSAPGGARLGHYRETQALANGPQSYPMRGEVTAIAFDQLDGDGITDLAAASSSELVVIHGRLDQPAVTGNGGAKSPWESASAKSALIERHSVPFAIRGLATGNFTFDRNHQREIALLSDEGTVHLSVRGNPDTRPYTKAERAAIAELRRSFLRDKIDMQTLTVETNKFVRPNRAAGWNVAETMRGTSAYTGTGKALFQRSNDPHPLMDELLIGDGFNNTVETIRSERTATMLRSEGKQQTSDSKAVSVASTPIAAVSMRLSVGPRPGLVTLGANSVEPSVGIITPDALFTVTSNADLPDVTPTAANGVCLASNGFCTLRAAVMQSNHTGGANTIMVPDNTYTLTLGPPDDEANTGGALEQSGDLDIFSWDQYTAEPILTAVAITGGTRDGCIIQMGTLSPTLGTNVPNNKERVLEVNDVVTIGFNNRINVTLTQLTIQNGFSPVSSGTNLEGGGVYFDGSDSQPSVTNLGLLTLNNVRLQGNTSAGQGGGVWAGFGSLTITNSSIVRANTANSEASGGVGWTGGNTVEGQQLNITNSTIGGAALADGNQAMDVTFGAPGGVDARGGSSVTISGSTIQNNTAHVDRGTIGGGGIQINSPSVAISTTTISNNKCKSNGGGIFNSARNAVTNAPSTTTLTDVDVIGNQADSDLLEDPGPGTTFGDGGGIFNYFGSMIIQTTSHIDGNSAHNGGGIFAGWTFIPADPAAGLTVQTNSTVGQVGAGNGNSARNNGGSISINAPAALFNPINLDSLTFANNTANSDNAGGGDGGAIFMGAGAISSLNNCTFDGNTVGTGGTGDAIRQTGGTIAGAGTLNFNNGETISLSGGTFTSTSGALNLTGNLLNSGGNFVHNSGTVTFNGSGVQSIAGTTPITFNNLIINNASGVNTVAASTAATGTLTLTLGALAPNAATVFTVNGPVAFTSGTFNANNTSTVNYAKTSNIQNIAPGQYGNLTFSNFTKQLPNPGTVKISNVFTTGAAGGHTVTGSTVEFNGTVAQTLPSGFTTYNNLTLNNAAGVTGFAGTMNVGGNWTNNFTFTPNGGTVNFNGSAGTQTVAGNTTFFNLTTNNSGATTAFGTTNTTVANTFTRTAGTMDPGTGTFTFTGAAGSMVGAAAKIFNNLVINGGATTSNPTGGNLTVKANFTNNGTFTQAAGIDTTFDNTNATHTLAGGGATTFGSVIISGSTALDAGSHNFSVAGPNFTVNGTFTGNTGTVTFIGTPQTIGGAGTKNFNNLTINNGLGGTTASSGSSPSVAGLLLIQSGTFTTASNFNNVQINSGAFLAGTIATTMNVTGAWTNNGGAATSFTPNGNTVNFNGSAAQTIGGTTATEFNNLTIANPVSVTMTQNETVNGLLTLTNNLTTGTFTLTMPASGTSGPATNAADVIGNVKRTGFALTTPLSFGNPFNTIAINSGAIPTDINVNLVKSSPVGFAGSVDRTYTITPNGAHGPVTLRLHYLDSELDSNTPETSLNLRRFNGVGWQPFAPTSSSTGDATNNWLEHNNVPTLSAWTFSIFSPTAADGTVTGRITDGNGVPVEGAVVRLSGTQNRKFITDANGAYRFEQVETSGFYTVTPSRANYTFNPASRSFSQMGQTTDAAFDATVASSGLVNPLDTPEYFVRQNYLDFLGREPDEAGFNFWSNEILGCGGDAGCVDRKRTNVSAAYFLSIEFQETGGLVDGLYRASFARRPSYLEFKPDAAAVAPLLVVGSANWQATLENGKKAFLDAFVQRAAFRAAYDGMSNDAYVDALITNIGAVFTSDERNALVNGLAGGMTRATVLRAIVEDADAVAAKRNEAFVMMEYFGYLRREPDAVGYTYWLDKLNRFNGNFEQAEMVRAFIISDEYRNRFPR